MSLSLFLTHFTGGNIWLLLLAITVCAIFLEDITVVIVGVLAADGIVPIPLAIASLYIGASISDLSLYTTGLLSRTHPRLARYIDHDFTAPFRTWFLARYSYLILAAHFVPGLRVTSYVASGFFRCPFRVFFPRALVSGLLLVMTLFTAAYWFGNLTSSWLGPARWIVAALLVIALFFAGRYHLLRYRITHGDSPLPPLP